MMYLGDIRVGKTLRFLWNTNAVAGESITRATNGTVSVYKDASTTQSTSGVTDTEDFDALTGVHLCAVDTSADGTFYSAGSDFHVVLSAATIDGKTINAALAHFSIENRSALMPTTDGRKLDVSAGGEAGIDWANVGTPGSTVSLSATTVATVTTTATATAVTTVNGLAANVITAASIATGAIDADAIADGAIDAGAIAADAITAAKIADGAIDAATFAAGAINNAAVSFDGSELTAIPWNAAWDAEVQSEVQDAIEANHLDHLLAVDYDPASKPGVATALLNELIESDAGVSRYTANALEQAPSGGGGVADWSADERTAIRSILGIPASGTTPDDPTTGILDTIRDYLNTEVADILADTNELQTDWANGGRLDLLVDAIKAKTDNLPADPADASDIASSFTTVNTKLDTIDDLLDTEVAAIKAKTDQLTFTTANRVDCQVHGMEAGTVTAAAIATGAIDADALAADAVTEIWTTALTESYAADGATFTAAQALYEICQGLTDFAISGTTLTVKRRDGTTTAATYTLDSSTAPTSRTRSS